MTPLLLLLLHFLLCWAMGVLHPQTTKRQATQLLHFRFCWALRLLYPLEKMMALPQSHFFWAVRLLHTLRTMKKEAAPAPLDGQM
jgi:hypothetical protein